MDTRFRGYEGKGSPLTCHSERSEESRDASYGGRCMAQAARRVHRLAGFFGSALSRCAQNDMRGGASGHEVRGAVMRGEGGYAGKGAAMRGKGRVCGERAGMKGEGGYGGKGRV